MTNLMEEIVGGGASKRSDKWLDEISIETEIAVATLQNNAGIVGTAIISVDVAAAAESRH